ADRLRITQKKVYYFPRMAADWTRITQKKVSPSLRSSAKVCEFCGRHYRTISSGIRRFALNATENTSHISRFGISAVGRTREPLYRSPFPVRLKTETLHRKEMVRRHPWRTCRRCFFSQ